MPTLDPVAPSDHALVESVRSGDDAAAEELYRRYAERLRRAVAVRHSRDYAARFDTEDILQSVFLRFFTGVRADAIAVPLEGELWGLLFVLALNKVEDLRAHHRASKRSVYRTTGVEAGESAAGGGAGAAPLTRLIVEEFLATLPGPDREVVTLRLAGHSVAEIATRTGRPLRTVERALHATRDRLADELRRD